MKRKLVVEFTKMQGAGNDFVVIDNRFYRFPEERLKLLAKRLCERRFSIGADGLLALDVDTESEAADFRMVYINSDGSRGSMCGNGARCLVRFARQAGIEKDEMVFRADPGIFQAVVRAEESGLVRLTWPDVSEIIPSMFSYTSPVGTSYEIHYVYPGVEHVVVQVTNLDNLDVPALGKAIRHHPALGPAGANVNFFETVSGLGPATVLRVRTFEKGVEDETLACGSGSMAVAVVSRILNIHQNTSVSLKMRGGTLRTDVNIVDGKATDLFQEGPAEIVFRGSVYDG